MEYDLNIECRSGSLSSTTLTLGGFAGSGGAAVSQQGCIASPCNDSISCSKSIGRVGDIGFLDSEGVSCTALLPQQAIDEAVQNNKNNLKKINFLNNYLQNKLLTKNLNLKFNPIASYKEKQAN